MLHAASVGTWHLAPTCVSRYPERVSGLVLVAPAITTSSRGFLAQADLGQLLRWVRNPAPALVVLHALAKQLACTITHHRTRGFLAQADLGQLLRCVCSLACVMLDAGCLGRLHAACT